VGTNSNSTSRIQTRGELTEFRVSFFADVNNTTPLVPISPSYPTYTIFDLNGVPVQNGVGTSLQPGQYAAQFQVPKDAPLSYFHQAPQRYGDEGQGAPLTADTSGRYRIEWQMATDANQQVNFVEEFDVRDVAVTQSLHRELKYLVLAGDPFRLPFRSATVPFMARMRLITRGNEQCPVNEQVYDATLPVGSSDLKWVKDGDSYVLYADIAQGVTQPNTAYMALWTIQDTALSMPVTEWNIITAINTNLLPLMTSLRMLIDRFQKRLGRLQAFEDSDLLEYLAQGLRAVNLSYPTTGYTMDSFPDDIQELVLLAAGWWGLQAQRLLEADLAFNFSGQSVTLSVDRTAQLDSAASSMMEMFNSKIGPAKMAYVRKAGGVGTVAGRAYNYRQMYQYVYKISSVNANSLMQTLTKIGLL
jgi:hypothetical protein